MIYGQRGSDLSQVNMRPLGITHDLIEAVHDNITRVNGDAAYDTVTFYDAASARGATVVVPPAKTAKVS